MYEYISYIYIPYIYIHHIYIPYTHESSWMSSSGQRLQPGGCDMAQALSGVMIKVGSDLNYVYSLVRREHGKGKSTICKLNVPSRMRFLLAKLDDAYQ
jgi:hypothetical protein